VAAELASNRACAGLVIQSTFTCIADIGADLFPWLPVRWLAHIRYDTLGKLPLVKAPVLVMHSRSDRLIHFRHSQTNFAAANEPKLFCELFGEHNSPLTNRAQFVADFDRFVALVERSQNRAGEARNA